VLYPNDIRRIVEGYPKDLRRIVEGYPKDLRRMKLQMIPLLSFAGNL
jgi:hypothetical protein